MERIARRARGRPTDWARDDADYANALAPTGLLTKIRSGPLYGFPDAFPDGEGAVRIDAANAHLLRGGLDEWLPDVAAGTPMVAMIVGGRAVSLCASVRVSPASHCAGVETLPDHRGRGLRALTVVDAFTRTALAIDVDQGIRCGQVVEAMTRIAAIRSAPTTIRVDNGPLAHLQGARPLSLRERRAPRLLQAWQAHGQRLCGKLKRKASRRMPEHPLVLVSG